MTQMQLDHSVGSATGDSFKWPSWLPVKINAVGIEWPNFNSDPGNFLITLSATLLISIAIPISPKILDGSHLTFALDVAMFLVLLFLSAPLSAADLERLVSAVPKAIAAALEKILAVLPLTTYPAGETILKAGTKTGRLLILKTGSVAILKDSVEIARVAHAGAVIGELSALLDQPHTADRRALR